MGESLPPLRVRENDGSPNLIPVYEIVLSSNLTLASKGPGVVVISATTGAGGTAQDPITFPLIAGSGGTGVVTIGSNQLILGSGTAPFVSFPALNSGDLIAGSSLVMSPQIFRSGSQGQVLVADSSKKFGLVWTNSNALGSASSIAYAQTGDTFLIYSASTSLTAARIIAASDNITIVSSGTSFLISAVTNAGGSSVVYAQSGDLFLTYGASTNLTAERIIAASDNITIVSSGTSFLISANTGPTTSVIRIPMSLLSVEVNSGNAYWTAQTDQGTVRMDKAYVNMADSGRSISTWWCDVPSNINASPLWSLDIVSEAAGLGATGGLAVLFIDGMTVTHGESANTVAGSTAQLVAGNSFLMQTAGILTISTMTATNFDAALATSATDYMKVKITRMGNADTFNSDWYIYSVRARFTVDT